MGLGSQQKRMKTYYMRLKSQREVNGAKVLEPHFDTTLYDEQGVKTHLDPETLVSGYLCAIGHAEKEWKGDIIPTVTLTLIDGDTLFKIQVNADSSMGRGLMNTVIGTRHFDIIKLSVRVKNDYPQLYVSNNDGKCEWKYDYKKDIEPLVETAPDPKRKGKTVKVYHKVNEMLWNDWLATESVVAEYARKMKYVANVEAAKSEGSKPQEKASGSLQDEMDNTPAPTDNNEPFFNDNKELPEDDLPF